ncbi:MAG: CheB methylesterase [Alphaproteobacteria bacterium]|nr:CheB methylesterase [Alphaproteobacteria bacterium]
MSENEVPAQVLIVIGGSSGGVPALSMLLSSLPEELPAAVLIVMHAGGDERLRKTLSRASRHPVQLARQGVELLASRVYLAPLNYHMVVCDHSLELTTQTTENRQRPAIDTLFRSAARNFHNRVIGVMLSGTNEDGAIGLYSVKWHGGISVVQSAQDDGFSSPPRQVSRYVEADYMVPPTEMGGLLGNLSRQLASAPITDPHPLDNSECEIVGTPPVVCPDCGGLLTEERFGDITHYRCRTGHAYSPRELSEAHADALEKALWIAIRTLNEQAEMRDRLARGLAGRGQMMLSERLNHQADAARSEETLIRQVIDRVVELRESDEHHLEEGGELV